jgi:hypothetical protein
LHYTTYCGSYGQDSCASYFETNLKIPSFVKLFQWDFNLAVGYNKFLLNPVIPCRQGYFLSLFILAGSNARVASNFMDLPYSDLVWTYGATTMKKMNSLYISKLHASALIDKSYYMSAFRLSNYYPSFQRVLYKNVSASFVNTGVKVSKSVMFKNCML